MFELKRAHLIFGDQDKKLIKEISKYCMITGYDFTLEDASAWAKEEEGEDPDLFLINGAVYFSGVKKQKNSKTKEFLRMLLTIKKHRRTSQIILLLPENKITDRELIINLIKMRVYNLWLLESFNEDDISKFICTCRTLEELEKYLEERGRELQHLKGSSNSFKNKKETIFKPYHVKSNIITFWSEDNTFINYSLAILTALNLAENGFQVAIIETLSHVPQLAGCISMNHPYYNTSHALSMYIQGNNEFIKNCLYNGSEFYSDPYTTEVNERVKYFPEGLYFLPDMKRKDNAAKQEMEKHWHAFITELTRSIVFEKGFHFLIFVGSGRSVFNDVILDELTYTKFITVDMLPSSVFYAIKQREKETQKVCIVGTNNIAYINNEIKKNNEKPFIYPPESFERDALSYIYSQDYRKITHETQSFINKLIELIGVKLPNLDIEKKSLVEKMIACVKRG
ncbi:MAG: hypothetical protein PHI90_09845 [Clostridia bacterium]|nr:hypothetical protein [Clostridia bacterium]MDD4049092.1 hypothetical protein [Clostridia bacterium]